MSIFKSWRSYHYFEKAVKRKNRYIHDSNVKDFLQAVLETSKSRIEEIKEGSILWRSQLGHDWEPYSEGKEHIDDFPCAFRPERMKPIQNSSSEGRANPKGIPYLYISTEMNTAMAEVRPWIGSYISMAQFKLLKSARLMNCTSDDKGNRIYLKEPEPGKREVAVWKDIDKAFAMPVTSGETIADYASTQILAELFKNNGFDGIAYRSSLGKGHNIMLFDLNAADPINCALYEAKKVSFDFAQISNRYFISKYYKK
ncbi:MAG: RES family NAD+ phosphorylase [Candidatus Omnitrophica bacterium]|nr:RES family NAD+ phosphorylase [Candidatus Omnitrophota bacterium]MBU1366778.1 RES family NAD+ phosphorylase [Candidatus Omnitrophota bacterium]MBU1523509.1 RES family NAD+ phosphorylase [Candidatus Omnitrophota bacterium]MBU2436881.1 RES family NAD+ phosphorylase [Candidatus Omnitrophota bacterium]